MAHFNSIPLPGSPDSAEECASAKVKAPVRTKVVSSSGDLANNYGRGKPPAIPQKAELEKMARRRYQNPKPHKRGAWWTLLIYRDRHEGGELKRFRQRIRLAPATMPVREVQKVAAEYLRPMNQGLETIGGATNFSDYVNEHYIPVTLKAKAKGTQERYEGVIRKYLEPAFGEMCLRELTPMTLERYFAGVASSRPELTRESLKKVRNVLGSIVTRARKHGLLTTNPLDGLELPQGRPVEGSKPWITPEQFDRLVALISEPYATMVNVAVWTGLRVSELIALRWNDVRLWNALDEDGADCIRYGIAVDERYCRGDWGKPKTKASKAVVGISAELFDRIQLLKSLTVVNREGVGTYKVVKSDAPTDLIFQSVKDGKPMRDNNILCRHIKPAGRKLGLGFVNWRCLRTSRATWAIEAGANPKDVQGMMRHSRISTTLDIYAQFVPESQFRAQERIEAMVAARREKQHAAQVSVQ
jgi:integrase